jgi:CRISPR-associated protein (TIGR02584 family)
MQLNRKILLCVTGLSPQVVTETCYALSQHPSDRWIPTEVHVITTRVGADNARLNLLSDSKGWFHRLRADYNLPAIKFDVSTIHIITDPTGKSLDDIRTNLDNQAAADFICAIVRKLTANSTDQLHVSIAGGRKSMGYYVGYALSLFGRPHDSLSHVLVEPAFENTPDFYYPTPYEYPVDVRQAGKTITMDAQNAEVVLADIPFVRLRDGQSLRFLNEGAHFSQVIDAIQQTITPPQLTIDLASRRVKAGNKTFVLAPVQLAFLAWFARIALIGSSGLQLNKASADAYAQGFLAEYRIILRSNSSDEATFKRLANGLDGDTFSEFKSKLHKRLKQALGPIEFQKYRIADTGHRGSKLFFLALGTGAIHFSSVPKTSQHE